VASGEGIGHRFRQIASEHAPFWRIFIFTYPKAWLFPNNWEGHSSDTIDHTVPTAMGKDAQSVVSKVFSFTHPRTYQKR
jgi:DNA-binding transcriptional regulator PaaX